MAFEKGGVHKTISRMAAPKEVGRILFLEKREHWRLGMTAARLERRMLIRIFAERTFSSKDSGGSGPGEGGHPQPVIPEEVFLSLQDEKSGVLFRKLLAGAGKLQRKAKASLADRVLGQFAQNGGQISPRPSEKVEALQNSP